LSLAAIGRSLFLLQEDGSMAGAIAISHMQEQVSHRSSRIALDSAPDLPLIKHPMTSLA
jgi:hypothetical protein